MQGILLIYLYYSAAEGGLGIDEATATSIVGAYGGAVYLSTILGAWLADRLLGPERTLFYSAILVMSGTSPWPSIPGLAGVGVGLVLIALGSGGRQGQRHLAGRHRCTTSTTSAATPASRIFYMGINLGALVGPLLTGLLQKESGFHCGLRAGRGRHGHRPDPVRAGPQEPPGGSTTCANPLPPAQRRRVRRSARHRAGAGRRARR